MSQSKLVQLMDRWADEKRYPIVADNDDMDKIKSALVELESCREVYAQFGEKKALTNLLVVFVETIYCLGFEAGSLAEQQRSLFNYDTGALK